MLPSEEDRAASGRLTSLQGVLSHGPAEDAQAGSVVGSHLYLVLGPDDELGDQAVADLGAADVPLLVLPGQAGQTVPAAERERRLEPETGLPRGSSTRLEEIRGRQTRTKPRGLPQMTLLPLLSLRRSDLISQ